MRFNLSLHFFLSNVPVARNKHREWRRKNEDGTENEIQRLVPIKFLRLRALHSSLEGYCTILISMLTVFTHKTANTGLQSSQS